MPTRGYAEKQFTSLTDAIEQARCVGAATPNLGAPSQLAGSGNLEHMGLFVFITRPNLSLSEGGIDAVVVNPAIKGFIPVLQKAYRTMDFISADDINDHLRDNNLISTFAWLRRDNEMQRTLDEIIKVKRQDNAEHKAKSEPYLDLDPSIASSRPEPTKKSEAAESNVWQNAKRAGKRTFLRHHHELQDVVENFVAKSKIEYRPDFFSSEVQTRKHLGEALGEFCEAAHKRMTLHDAHVARQKKLHKALDETTLKNVSERYDDLLLTGPLTEKDKKFIALVDHEGLKVATRRIRQNLESIINQEKNSYKSGEKQLNKTEGHPFNRLLGRLYEVNGEVERAGWNLGVNILHGAVHSYKQGSTGLALAAGYVIGHAGASLHAAADAVTEGTKEAVVTPARNKMRSAFTR